MRLPRPGLPRPWRWRLRRSGSAETAEVPSRQTVHEEDLRLIRRTRLRLMGVSGLVTLLILVVLEAAVYGIVSDRIETAARDQLTAAATRETVSDDPYGFAVEGPTAGLFSILVSPQGTAGVSRGLLQNPAGLPDTASLAAVVKPGDVDIRDITLADGTPYRVLSGFSASPRYVGYKVQWVQFRSGEVNLLNTLGAVLLGGGLIALLAALLAGYLYAGRALVPIRASIDRRQEALQRQREFAANASHELRTPITVIAASVEDLKRNRRSKVEDVGEALGDIEAEVRHMTALVEDMLLLARTDSGVVQIERVPLTGDPLRLRQLVTILVDNAIRHSPSGSTVAVWVRPEAGSALLQVDDQGAGIKPEDLPRLFERFWRADNAPAGGTGLGLAIAKWIVDQHGGTIGAFNRPGSGASFWARLPNVQVGGAAGGSGQWTAEVAEPPALDRPEGPAAD